MSRFFALRADGTLWGAGDNQLRALGGGTSSARTIFGQVATNQLWRKVATSRMSSAGIALDGSLWVWGTRTGFLPGMTGWEDALTPARMSKDTNWVDVIASSFNFCARDIQGR